MICKNMLAQLVTFWSKNEKICNMIPTVYFTANKKYKTFTLYQHVIFKKLMELNVASGYIFFAIFQSNVPNKTRF